ncbi:hypothetical protein Scep_013187 [Stephania cephalantha]|uniref:Terpene synthase N-terminal domain-containing protein n=1 Tax=Stephania cephalantha TaxID=152367 RepID=A0AAP0P888_9MAGN
MSSISEGLTMRSASRAEDYVVRKLANFHPDIWDVFNKFKDDKGEFKSCLIDDVKGMLSLYEAAHIRFHGEDVLDEALIFTTTNLTSMMKSSTSFSCSPLGRQVKHSLDQPFHKAISRLEARKYYILFYQLENEKLLSTKYLFCN